MKIYIDSDYKCHTSPGEGLTEIQSSFFDGMAPSCVEGYRFVPEGKTWAREDGTRFNGEMIAAWVSSESLDSSQREYEREQVQNLTTQNEELLSAIADMVEEVYTSDLEVMES